MPSRRPPRKLLRLFKEAIRRQIPQALRDGRDAAFAYAKSDALPHLKAAFEDQTYFTATGDEAPLGAVSRSWQEFKEREGYDERLGHMTNELSRAIGHEKGLKTFGKRATPSLSYDFKRALKRGDRDRADGYAATKAPGLGMFSKSDVQEMKRLAIAAFVRRMELILRSSGFPGSRLVQRRRKAL